MVAKLKPIIVIVGETGSGKSAAALELAERIDGEIICADSRTVYRGMDIGTAKPTMAEQAAVTHHLLDVVTPDQAFTAAEFKDLANSAIADIKQRGKVPIMVGGTGLYVDAVLFDYDFRPAPDPRIREELMKMSVPELHEQIVQKGLDLPNNSLNPRHLMRVLESDGQSSEKKPIREDALIFGLEIERERLKQRINKRTRQMIQDGLLEEAEVLAKQYGWEAPGMNAIGYRELKPFFDGLQTQEKTVLDINRDTLLYAKRQRTWFRRNKRIQWQDSADLVSSITKWLQTVSAE